MLSPMLVNALKFDIDMSRWSLIGSAERSSYEGWAMATRWTRTIYFGCNISYLRFCKTVGGIMMPWRKPARIHKRWFSLRLITKSKGVVREEWRWDLQWARYSDDIDVPVRMSYVTCIRWIPWLLRWHYEDISKGKTCHASTVAVDMHDYFHIKE